MKKVLMIPIVVGALQTLTLNFKWSVLGLATEWRFEKGDRKSYSGSSESEYKNKSS